MKWKVSASATVVTDPKQGTVTTSIDDCKGKRETVRAMTKAEREHHSK